MKRIYMLSLMLMLFASTSFAQITVKFHKPDSWTEVSLYTWGPEVTGGWPGAVLTEVDGWFTYTFDEAFTGANLIFNNNGAGEQTEDYVISSDVCLESAQTLNTNGKYSVTVVPCTAVGWTVKFHKPDTWTEVSLYTWGPEVTGGWPGAVLTEVDGWYTFTFDETFTGANLIFNNNGAGEQTEDYAITGEVCLEASQTLNTNGKYDVTVVPCVSEGWTVKFKEPASWTAVSLYTYGPEVTGGWPGATLTKTGDWYTYTFDDSFTAGNLIFNNAGAGEQTEDFVMSGEVCLEASQTLNTNGKYDVMVVPCNGEGITVRFTKPEAWTSVNLYAWYGPEGQEIKPLGGWPGGVLTEEEGYYSYTFDGAIEGVNVIFNQNGSPQTASAWLTTNACFVSDGTSLEEVDCNLGINDLEADARLLYPNPATDQVQFLNARDITSVTIQSITGKKVMMVNELSSQGTLNVSSLSPGIYFVTVSLTNGKQRSEKIVIR
ncbi:MAG: starch-binding protein [Lentimicrobium sp.]|jgi:hypothetical protein|nr:starch-binding protein [Lentimicrobium sp.]